ncbi:spinster family MFS transporter [Sphingobium nicotianae]|uniref:MFS transporter n=1 Tax=Sphingobium nicotianae TaxID=2782607 RepID=A0A9X1AJH0_9SPHN|nr:MFS transporter [Sphingobium nicotianae]MBT2185400.1 MFS transporter [Sphingobium nicotianae]
MRTSKIALFVLFVVYFFSSIDRSIVGILAQPVKEELLLSDTELGFLTGFAFSAVYMLFGLPMARIADQGRRVNILALCVAFWSIMTALCGMSLNFMQLCLARMGVGVGEAGCLPTSHSLISDYFPPSHRTKALAIYGLGYPAGALAGSIIGGFVLDHWGWRTAFYVVGLPGLLVALATWWVVKEPQRGQSDSSDDPDSSLTEPRSFRDVAAMLCGSQVLRHMLFAMTVLAIFTSPTATFLGAFLVRKFHISYTEVGMIFGISMMLAASFSTLFGGILAQRLARRDQRWLLWFPAISVSIAMPFYVTALLQDSPYHLGYWLFFGALCNATYLAPCYTVLYSIIPPGGRAKAAVIVSILIGLVGQSFGPLLAGIASDMIAADRFGHGFAAACPGGMAPKGAAAVLDAACRGAVVDATQIVLIVTMIITVWPAFHFYLAARKMTPPFGRAL